MTDHDDPRRPVDPARLDPPGACPDPETFAAYLDGTLAASERAAVEAHVAGCADCREVLAESARFREGESPVTTPVVPFYRRRNWAVAASVLAAAAVVVFAVWVVRTRPFAGWFGPSATRPELAQLVAAVGDHRPIVPRLTGGFAYGPPPSPMRGTADREVPPDVRIAAAEIEKLEEQHDTPQNEGALGVAYLVSGEVDKAVQSLEDAVAQEPGNGDLQSDLAAAYLVQATQQDRAEDYPKALTAAERADQGEAFSDRSLVQSRARARGAVADE